MKKVFFLARDPGGANNLVPLIKSFSNSLEYDCSIFAKDYACDIFKNEGLNFSNIETIEEIEKDFTKYDFVITGTSYADDLEKDIWALAKKKEVKSFAYMDHWMGYNRFYYSKNGSHIFPNKLMLIDHISEKVLNEKYDNVNTCCVGSPFLEKIMLPLIKKEINDVIEEKENYFHYILYAAELIKGYTLEEKYGFNEYTQLLKFMHNLKEKTLIYFLPHPKHNIDEVKKELSFLNLQNKNIDIRLVEHSKKYELMNFSDYIIGINTMVLVEAMILGYKTASLQFDIKKCSDFQLLKENYIYKIKDCEDLNIFLENKYRCREYDISNILDSVNRMKEVIIND